MANKDGYGKQRIDGQCNWCHESSDRARCLTCDTIAELLCNPRSKADEAANDEYIRQMCEEIQSMWKPHEEISRARWAYELNMTVPILSAASIKTRTEWVGEGVAVGNGAYRRGVVNDDEDAA